MELPKVQHCRALAFSLLVFQTRHLVEITHILTSVSITRAATSKLEDSSLHLNMMFNLVHPPASPNQGEGS